MKAAAVDLAAVECARMGCPEPWIRELVAEAGRPMDAIQWHRYWRMVSRMAQDGAGGHAA